MIKISAGWEELPMTDLCYRFRYAFVLPDGEQTEVFEGAAPLSMSLSMAKGVAEIRKEIIEAKFAEIAESLGVKTKYKVMVNKEAERLTSPPIPV